MSSAPHTVALSEVALSEVALSQVALSDVAQAGRAGARVKRSLILAGGGMRVAYQAGVLQALEEAGLTFSHADGTSGGTINLAMLFSGLRPAEMCERWRSLQVRDFVSFLPLGEYLRDAGALGLGGADGILRHVFPHLGIDVGRINAATGMEGTFNVCNFTRKNNRAVPHRELVEGLLVAGISLPGFMPPVRVAGEDYVDSVWIRDANVLEAVRRGAEEIWLVWCIGNSPRYRGGAFNQYVHMIELSASGALFADLSYVLELNQRIAAGDSPWGQRAPIRLKVIKPEYPLPLDPSYYAGAIDGAALVSLGYRDAWRRLQTRDADDELGETATSMRDLDRAVAFRESWTGSLDWASGNSAAANPIELGLSVFVHELPRFLAAPERGALLAGTLTPSGSAPLGLRGGTFRCITGGSITGGPITGGPIVSGPVTGGPGAVHRMIYEASFQRAGATAPEHLVLERRLGEGGVAQLLEALTTAHVSIHAGSSRDAPQIASGVLRTSPQKLREWCRALLPVEPDSPQQAAETLLQLGRFLFGELYTSYTHRPWWKFW